MTDSDLIKLVITAKEAAVAATNTYIAANPEQWYPCGFAWVIVKPARGKLADLLKSLEGARPALTGGGLRVYNPSGHPTQSMEAKSAGARAYAKVLSDAGFKAVADSRMD